MKALHGKTALVTGVGRRQGIGYALCELLCTHGADVFYTYWHEYDVNEGLVGSDEDPHTFALEFMSHKVQAYSMEIDLSSPDAPAKLFAQAQEKLGGVDILINNACFSTRQELSEITGPLLDAHYAVNVRAVVLLCKEFVLNFNKTTGGKIVNLSSGQSLGIMENELPYTITKAAVEMLSLQLAFELREKGITINAVDPGPTDTGWITSELRKQIQSEPNATKIHSPKTAAELVFSLIQGQKEATTGSVLHAER